MNIIIRADASLQIGTGHVMRCLALAQAWVKMGRQAIFAIATATSTLEQRLRSHKIDIVHISAQLGSVEDAMETINLAKQMETSWIIVDGYHFGSEYQQIIKKSGLHLLFIDDYGHAESYCADIVLNQNIYANESLYSNREPDTQLLLGTHYTLLRQEFCQWQGSQREIPLIPRKILVTLGGSDRDNVTLKVIQALQQVKINGLEVVVVIGESNPHEDCLRSAVQESQFSIRLENNVPNMPELIAWADLAIAAGGSTSWELAFMGLPSLMLILADNQRGIVQRLGEMGLTINLGWYEDISTEQIASAISRQLQITPEQRTEISRGNQELVDGEGSNRVLGHLEKKLLKFRSVCEDDCRLIWEWANDPEVRAISFSSEPILWEEHIKWFQEKFRQPDYIIYIALNQKDIPIGQIRYEIKQNEAVVSIIIDRHFRRQGYGTILIELASEKLFHTSAVTKIHAYIKPENKSSMRAFIKNGFQNLETTTVRNQPAIHLVKTR